MYLLQNYKFTKSLTKYSICEKDKNNNLSLWHQVIEKCEDGVLKLKEGLEVTLRRLEGEEEATFLETAKQNISARRAKGNQQGRQRGGHRGGRRGGRGGRGR